MALFTFPAQAVSIPGAATETTLQAVNASVQAVDASIQAQAFLTDTELRASAVPVSAASLPLPSGAATEATLASLDARIAGSLVPEQFDYQDLTYVLAGNGIGEVSTVVYKQGGSGGTTVATVTLTYDAQNRVSTVTRS
jgi:hypothetical protein